MTRRVQATVVVPTTTGGDRLRRALASLEAQTVRFETIVVDNRCDPASIDPLVAEFPAFEFLRLRENAGFSRAVNLAARRAQPGALVLINDDCTCDPEFVGRLAAALDPARGIVMAAGVLRDVRDESLIDTAGMQLDTTLLVFDYLNGRPLSVLDAHVPDPIGPCGAAAVFDRDAFVDAGGFDETLFAYWEDVDLVLRLRREGARCVLVPGAQGVHEHSATLGSGSAGKNFLVGFGRGYVLRKWSVLSSPRRAAAALAADVALCAGQAVFDRTLAGTRGRIAGWRAGRAVPAEPYPGDLLTGTRDGLLGTLARRLQRRRRLGAPRARPS